MIITLTLNPAIDKTVHVKELLPGGLNRIGDVIQDAGGKGVNVSKIISVLGGKSLATGFCGGSVGTTFLTRLEELGLSHDFIIVASNTRINTKVVDETYGLTELNEPGVVVTPAEEAMLLEKLLIYADPEQFFVLSGSLHSNASPDFYCVLAESLKNQGATVFLDADGSSFAKALAAKPHFIKPNREELKAYSGNPDMTDEELFDLCRQFVADGIGLVALSLGGDGAAFFTEDEAYFAPALTVEVSSTVGAGDSMVGAVAYALQQGLSLPETVKLAVACGTGAVTTKGTTPPTFALIEELQNQVTLMPL